MKRMMQNMGVAGVLGLMISVGGGCATDTSPAAGYGDPYPAPLNDPQISVLDELLRPWLGFQPATVRRGGNDVLEVQVPVRNLAERKYLIDYRILFFDGDGMQLEPTMGWSMIALEPKQVGRLSANSLDDRASNYRLEVKWAR